MDKLRKLREEIDTIDKQLVRLISRRLYKAELIGKIKKENNLPVIDLDREREILVHIEQLGNTYHLSISLLKSLWQNIFQESHKAET